jgi:hypothetical protein
MTLPTADMPGPSSAEGRATRFLAARGDLAEDTMSPIDWRPFPRNRESRQTG